MGSSILMDSLDRFDPSLLLAVPLLPSAWYPVEEDAVVVIVDELDRELALSALGCHSNTTSTKCLDFFGPLFPSTNLCYDLKSTTFGVSPPCPAP